MPLFVPTPLAACARNAAIAVALCSVFAAPSHAVTITELGDAGQTKATAQSTLAVSGALTDIVGSLSSATDADLYVIHIGSPGSFSATTVNATGGFLDTQLFLLTLAGAPVYLNDDDAGGLSVLSTLPSGSSFGPVAAGDYLLGVSLSGYDPINSGDGGPRQALFANGLSTAVRGPASGLQPALLGGFADNTYYADSGAYDIQLTGVGPAVAAIPEPSTSALLLIGGGLCAYAGRRRGAALAAA